MANTAAQDIILSIRDQIPDPIQGDDANLDGKAFSRNTLIRWINDAGRLICTRAAVLQDWYGLSAVSGQNLYVLPGYITAIEEMWYNLLYVSPSPEGDTIFPSKATGKTWSFGPHSIHATPRVSLFPAPSASAGATTLSGSFNAGATSLTLAAANFVNPYGFFTISSGSLSELCYFASVTTTAVTNIIKGQGGTKDQSWTAGATITECDIIFKCFRLPNPLVDATSIFEVPQALWPIVELYVLSKVRSAEQDAQEAMGLRKEFDQACESLGTKGSLRGLKQGIQVKTNYAMPNLWAGRTYIP